MALNPDRVNRLTAILELLSRTSDEDYPALREQIVDAGELTEIPVPYNPFALGIALAGYDPATIERDALRACLTITLQVAYASAWLSAN